jgi:hypothetical protein
MSKTSEAYRTRKTCRTYKTHKTCQTCNTYKTCKTELQIYHAPFFQKYITDIGVQRWHVRFVNQTFKYFILLSEIHNRQRGGRLPAGRLPFPEIEPLPRKIVLQYALIKRSEGVQIREKAGSSNHHHRLATTLYNL